VSNLFRKQIDQHFASSKALAGALAAAKNTALPGTISIVGETSHERFENVATLPSEKGARTIATDPATHRLYLPTADFKAVEGGGKPQGLPESLHILVLQRK